MQQKKSYPFRILPQEVDFQCKATMATIGTILLNAAGYNADENGFGIPQLNEINCTWVLTRFAVEMKRFPEQYEIIQVETWIEDVGRATTTRNFCIRDAKNGMECLFRLGDARYENPASQGFIGIRRHSDLCFGRKSSD